MLAGIDVCRPTVDLAGPDGEEVGHVGADWDDAIPVVFGSQLEIEELVSIRAERVLQP